MNLLESITLRSADQADYSRLSAFIISERQVHRHLDWRAPLEWLGSHPFLIAERQRQIEAVLACPPDPKDVAWVRLFCAANPHQRWQLWAVLLEAALDELHNGPPVRLAAIALQDWFQNVLEGSGFVNRHNIVVLEWDGGSLEKIPVRSPIQIRPMLPEDLPDVERVDWLSFEPLWRNSQDSLELAYEQSAYSTVAENESGIIGYQISTAVPLSGHLARLAVHPDQQRSRIGYELVRDTLAFFKRQHAWRVTVNTQSNNLASLALYQKIGFRRSGEEFRVYEYPNPIGGASGS
ncbi:MAG TPA: GNAT family N-acetyltransferase [Anaerolineaceae bacterium]|nr:GNAT family N-acetyltransferase [Anaerolineaceae bacterium]